MNDMLHTVNALQRRGTRTFTVKSGQAFMEGLKDLWNDPAKRQVLTKGLIGAGGGALALGGLRAFRSGDRDKKEKARGVVSSALLGALLGGTTGAGLGLAEYATLPSKLPGMEDIPDRPFLGGAYKDNEGKIIGTAAGTALAGGGMAATRAKILKETKEMAPSVMKQVMQNEQSAAEAVRAARRALDAAKNPIAKDVARKQLAEATEQLTRAMKDKSDDLARAGIVGATRATRGAARGGRALRYGKNLLAIPAGYFGGKVWDDVRGNPGAKQRYMEALKEYERALRRGTQYARGNDRERAEATLREVVKRLTEG